jgi:hypothetical protein
MKEDRQRGSFAVSLAIHLAVGALLIWVLSIPAPLRQWLTARNPTKDRPERIGFFRLPGSGRSVAGRAGGNGRARSGNDVAPRSLVAPTTIPPALEPSKPGAPAVAEPGTGPIISMGGAGKGIMPELHDPRIWIPPGAVIMNPIGDSASFDSAFHETLAHLQDTLTKSSAAKALSGIFSAGGKKYGLDSSNIYIADFKIPSALLAVLPIHPTGYATPEQSVLVRQSAEVNYQAGRALDAEDFHTAIKRIRQRKEREKRAREAALGKNAAATASVAAPEPVRKPPPKDPIALQTP